MLAKSSILCINPMLSAFSSKIVKNNRFYEALWRSFASRAGYDYDMIVIGGGSGGISCAQEANRHGAHVALLDYVDPSNQGTKWGIGGTCVNVGCIPKKLFHLAAQYSDNEQDAEKIGFGKPLNRKPDWSTLVGAISDHIMSMNFKYRTSFMDEGIDYINGKGSFIDQHTLAVKTNKEEKKLTAENIVIAVGGRPVLPNIPGAREYAVTSDDIFRLQKAPGKTLVVGASYIALECAGFLHSLGFDTSVMVRSRVLRRFDKQMGDLIKQYMEDEGIVFHDLSLPSSITKKEDGRLEVKWVVNNVTEKSDVFDTVLFATGRHACTDYLNLKSLNIWAEPDSGKIVCSKNETTRVGNVHVIGDARYGNPELTPVAIKQGQLLADRLYGESTKQMDYSLIPTTVFTPLEYSCVGLTEEEALKEYGGKDIDVFHMKYNTLEMSFLERMDRKGKPFENVCYSKLICVKENPRRVIGAHILGPNSGEIIQGLALAMKLGVTKDAIEDFVPIHPTHGEEVFNLSVTKEENRDVAKRSC